MGTGRNQSVDALKLVAAFGVIIIHLAPSTATAESFTRMFSLLAVPYFLVSALYFFIQKVNALAPPRLADLRLDRLVVPYLVWTVIYTVMRAMKFRLAGRPLELDLIGVTFFGGGAVQLYFVPLLLLFQAQALAVILWLRGRRWFLVGAGVALGAAIFGYLGSNGGYFAFHGCLQRGAAFVALAFLLRHTQATATGRKMNAVLGCLIFVLIATTAWLGYPLDTLGVMRDPVVGYAVSAFALNWPVQVAGLRVRTLLTCSYGIYLAHFGFLESFEFLAGKLNSTLTPYPISTKLLFGSLICVCSIIFIALARRHGLTAYLLLGESRPRKQLIPEPSSPKPV